MENTNIVQSKTSLRKIIFMMISILTLVLLINFVFISFGHAIIIDGGSSGCSTCCTNECSSGQKRCSGTTGYQTCGNYDTDSCLEWGGGGTCSGSTACDYGSCSSTQKPQWYCTGSGTCSYTCYTSSSCQPACTPATCSSLGKSCGSWSNGCGGTISCGSCSYNQTCSNGQCINNCTPATCSSLGKSCGSWSNGCGSTISCGSCSYNQTCSNGQCINNCTPATCSSLGKSCGSWSNGCGSTISCGSCSYNQTCSNGQCVSNCTNECTGGATRCSGNGYQNCGNYDSDSCTEWSNIISCYGGQTCSNGSCIDTCSNECVSGSKRCNGNGYQVCSNYDTDSCTEWSVVISCPSGQCSNGSCTCDTCDTCNNECSYSGQKECSGNNSRICGNYDSDTCLEWSSYSYDSSCVTCTNDCSYSGQKQCIGNNAYQTCGNYDSDTCLEWGATTNCPSDTCVGNSLRHYYCNCGSGCGSGCQYTDTPNSPSCGYSNPINLSCNGSPNPAQIGQTVSFVSIVSGGTGSYTYSWTGDCTGNNQNCSQSYLGSGNKTTTIYVTSGNQTANASCSVTVEQSCPSCTNECSYSGQKECSGNNSRTCGNYDSDTCLEWSSYSYDSSCVTCTNECSYSGQKECSGTSSRTCGNYDSDTCLEWTSYSYDSTCGCPNNNCNNTLGCYDNDVYYLNYLGQAQNRYQDCGDNHCDNFAQNYCYNGDVYRSRTCYNKGCSGSSCYSYTNTEQQLYQDCTNGQTCSNGQCVNQCECTSGPCCDGCHYKTSATVCDTNSEVEYSCPWGTGCGSDVGKRLRTQYKYCSGSNATCSGNWSSWGAWTTYLTADYCSTGEGCSAGNQTCTYKSSCNQVSLTKGCYQNDVYWFDLSGNRGAKYKSCDDSNSCTADGCTTGKCTNIMKCDGTTCAKDSKDYCDNCEHCGDGICGCEETPCSCPADCKVTTISVSLLGKNTDSTNDWQESMTTSPNTNIQFLLIFANNGDQALDNVLLSAAIPSEITVNNDVKIDGMSYGGDIRSGINLIMVASKGIKTVTFSGKVAKAGDIDLAKANIGFTANAVAKNISVNDSISIALSGAQGTNVGSASLADILRGWLLWAAVILISIVLLLLGGFYLIFWLIRQRRQRITFQNQEVTLR